jgi:hypothetical protein
MSLESEARTLTTADQADNGAQTESQGWEPVLRDGGTGALRPEQELEQPHVRGETFVIEGRHPSAASEASRSVRSPQSEAAVPLFDQAVAKDFRSRWNEIQVAFVDEPREAVRRADQLVAETIKELSESFTAERQKLEVEWDRGGNDSTEALRLALQRYRSFFNRLLSV